MYYKINETVMFRQYEDFGYITDNSAFGYRSLNDDSHAIGERFVSESGAVMLSMLSKHPRSIDEIIHSLLAVFIDVDFEELRQDTIEFYNAFVKEGFLSCGETIEQCNKRSIQKNDAEHISDLIAALPLNPDDCSDDLAHQDPFLRSLHIEITDRCNERCVHCYIPHEIKNTSMDSDLCFRILSEAREMNIVNITLSGGEPLLHKDIIAFLAKCRELDMSVNVLSNLTLVTDAVIDEMKRNPLLSVQTSLYSMDPSIHDKITASAGSFDNTYNNLLKLKAAGIPLQISCPVMKQNLETYSDVISWGEANNIAVTCNYVIFASYNHTNCNLENRLSIEEAKQAFDAQASEGYLSQLHSQAQKKEALSDQEPICSICRNYFCISADGFAFPCVGWRNRTLGDLNKQSLKEIWFSSEEIKKLREVKHSNFPKCVNCENRGYCTICMMSNSNESPCGDPFEICEYHCEIAAFIHEKVNSYCGKK